MSSTQSTVLAEHGIYQIDLIMQDDSDYDFEHYGKFCNEKDIGYDDFAIRNPDAWVMEDLGNGTPSWVQVERNRAYPWFKLAEHPKHAVAALMASGKTERAAWQQVLDEHRATVEKIVRGNLYAIVVGIEVRYGDEVVGASYLGGIEIDATDRRDVSVIAREAAEEHGLIDEATKNANEELRQRAIPARVDAA